MKLPNLPILTFSLLACTALVAQQSPPSPPHEDDATAVGDCLNPGATTGYCGSCECPDDPEYSPSSLILNSILNYYGWANEFKTPSASGCAPCGGAGATNGTLPSLELNRFYHIRGNDIPFLSFGFGTQAMIRMNTPSNPSRMRSGRLTNNQAPSATPIIAPIMNLPISPQWA